MSFLDTIKKLFGVQQPATTTTAAKPKPPPPPPPTPAGAFQLGAFQ